MQQEENNCGTSTSGTQSAPTHPDSVVMPGEGIGSEVSVSTNGSSFASVVFAIRKGALINSYEMECAGMFVIQRWHRHYAEALIETDPAKLLVIIAQAEEAILARSLELSGSQASTEETLDLREATKVLEQIRSAHPHYFVA